MSWFKKSRTSKRLDDKVYINDNAKFNALVEELSKPTAGGIPLFAVCFFDETKERTEKLLSEKQVKTRNIEKSFAGDLSLSSDGEVYLIHAKTLARIFNLKKINQRPEKTAARFVFAEHYPFFSKEEEVLSKIDLLTDNSAELLFFVSLDEAFMQVFGSENIKSMMQKMGLEENECIEHGFVNKSIINAQKKIEGRVGAESEAVSQDEWFRKNYGKQ